mmetsp:Transcript_86263/g.252326  ORF Transcript_86263/g.252326 Transcript_86263/m.252326 type:complete len:405 (-) Transcript_86263:6-1220(-)
MFGCLRNRHGRQPALPEPLVGGPARPSSDGGNVNMPSEECATAGSLERNLTRPSSDGGNVKGPFEECATTGSLKRNLTSSSRRGNTDEEAVFVHSLLNAAEIEAAIAASVGPRLEEEVRSSLRETMAALSKSGERSEEDARHPARLPESNSDDGEEGSNAEDGCKSRQSTSADEEEEEGGNVEDGCKSQQISLADEEEAKLAKTMGFAEVQSQAEGFLRSIGLRPQDVGARNTTRWHCRVLWNQCFYLSLARAYLGHEARWRKVRIMALYLRRAIEAVVLQRYPDWAAELEAGTQGTGKAMVFADFLPIAMRAEEESGQNLLAAMTVCILDSVNGHVEVYIGPKYSSLQDEAEKQKNLLLLWYKPWHYQCLVRDNELGSKVDLSYDGFKALLTEHGVVYIETLE